MAVQRHKLAQHKALFLFLLSQLHTVPASRYMLTSDISSSRLTPFTANISSSSSNSANYIVSASDAAQYLHAGCAVFLDNSTIYSAQSPHSNDSVLYRGMTATVINFASSNVTVPWTFHLSSSPPGYSAIKQAYNFENSTVSNGQVSGTATQPYLNLLAKAGNNVTLGLLLEANATTFPLPQSFKLNNRFCSVVVLPDNVPLPANITSPPLAAVQTSAGSGLTTLNGQIIDETTGEPVQLRGFNYFGFDNAQTCVDGLYAGSTTLSRDLVTIIRTQQALGFNAVRLLTSFGTIFGLPPVPQSRSCTPVNASDYQAYLTDPGVAVAAGATIPELAYTPPTTEGICSDYLDGQPTTLDRYIFVISLFARNGFYVVLDNQLNDDPTLINQGEDVWLGYWRQIATAVAADPYAVNKVIIDGLNEPDSYGIRWEATPTRPGYGPLLLSLMDALYPIIPGSLFFVEGTAQECNGGPSVNWGDGLATQVEVFADYSSCSGGAISDPGPAFFDPLLTRPYLSQVVISPHVYGPSISGSTLPVNSGAALWNRLSQSFGYLNLAGYGGHVFPIAVGEFGSTLTQAADVALFADLASYFRNQQLDGTPVDDLHNPITSFFWFAWNANAGDTGGLVNPPDWDTIVWPKIEYLQTLGLAPWYTGAAPATSGTAASFPAPIPPSTIRNTTPIANTTVPATYTNITAPLSPLTDVNTTPAAATPAVPTPANMSSPASNATEPLGTPGTVSPISPQVTPAVAATPAPISAPNPTPVVAPASTLVATPSLTQTAPLASLQTPIPAVVPPVKSACSYWGGYSNYWFDPSSGPYIASVSLNILNIGTEMVPTPWLVAVTSAAYTSVQYSWNWQIDASGLHAGCVSGSTVYDWEALIPGGNEINVGYIAGVSDPSDFMPVSVSVNGQQCSFAT